jgi:hypothetical protein
MKKRQALSCLLLLFALVASSFGGAIADNNTAMNNTMSGWDGLYTTNVKDTSEQWALPGTLLVSWEKEVRYEGTPISNAQFFNNSSIFWTEDANWGSGRIWFTYGDNRSQYWPDGPATGRVFAGWIQVGSAAPADLRGINDSIDQKGAKKCDGACPDLADSCSGCSNGRICSSGKCVCPGGTTDCNGQCIVSAPCGGGCQGERICSNERCICPQGTRECNDRCIKITECCDGCPPWQICEKGRCVCPPGVKNCPDPLPL